MIFKRLKKFDPEKEKALNEQIQEEGGVEKKDMLAMVISAFLVFIPAALVALGIFLLFTWLFLS